MANLDENRLIIPIKKLNVDAVLPKRMRDGDIGYDLTFVVAEQVIIAPHEVGKFGTGLAIAIPHGYGVFFFDRSGLGMKGLKVHGGVIDPNYRGELIVGLCNNTMYPYVINKGERVAQMIVQKVEDADFIEVDDLDKTNRGTSGFGSSDYIKQYSDPIQG